MPPASVTVTVATLVAAANFLAASVCGEIHLGVFELADQAIDGGAIGAQGARLDDLPLVLAVLAEFDGRRPWR